MKLTWYDAMQLQIDRPMRGTRWGGSVAYTRARSEEQGQTQSGELFWGFDDHYPTVPNIPRRRAPGNQEHQIVANGMVRLPSGHDRYTSANADLSLIPVVMGARAVAHHRRTARAR